MKDKNAETEGMDLSVIYRIKDTVKYDEEDGHVRIITEQNRRPQKVMRRIGIKIPLRSYKELDDYGSFIFKHIDGQKTIEALGQELSIQYDEAGDYLYERLVIYLNHLEKNEKWIEKLN